MRRVASGTSWIALGLLTAGAAVVPAASCSPDRRRPASEDHAPERRDPSGAVAPGVDDDYVLVGAHGATAFEAPPAQPVGATGTRIGRGFGFVPTGETRVAGGRRYLRLRDGRWLLEGDVSHVRPSRFTGERLKTGPSAHRADGPGPRWGEPLRLAWAIAPNATVFARPDLRSPALALRPRGARVALVGPCRDGFCPLALGWIRAADLARPELAPRPAAAGPRERWLDVDVGSQTLVAYEGDEPVFATLVSTGIGRPGSPFDTPAGVFRIRSKHTLVKMDNLEHTGVELYSYDVPLTQYFTEGKALHAAPWHDQLGRPHSHGCINLSPADANWLFDFTSPSLLAGATEVAATSSQPGTLVRIRGQL